MYLLRLAYAKRRSGEVQEYVSSILGAYLKHNGSVASKVLSSKLGEDGGDQQNVVQIGIYMEGVNSVKDSNEHQAKVPKGCS